MKGKIEGFVTTTTFVVSFKVTKFSNDPTVVRNEGTQEDNFEGDFR